MTVIKIVLVAILSRCTWLLFAYSTTDPLTTAEDFQNLDKRITRRIGTTKKGIWDEMVDDIVFYTHSLVNFHWSLEQNTTGFWDVALDLVNGGKPLFIDCDLKKRANKQLNLTEWDFYRFFSLRLDADLQWKKLTRFINDLKFNQTL